MPYIRFDPLPCPIACGLDRVGAWWSLLIRRGAFHGKTRFRSVRRQS
jgi:DNA-binding HxlR family transcriptional regulator